MFFFQLIYSSQYIFALIYSLPPSFVIGLKKKRNISVKLFPQVKAFIIKSLSNILRTACHLLRYPQLQSDEQRITLPFHRHAKRVRIRMNLLFVSLPFHNIWQLHHVRCFSTRFQPCLKNQGSYRAADQNVQIKFCDNPASGNLSFWFRDSELN